MVYTFPFSKRRLKYVIGVPIVTSVKPRIGHATSLCYGVIYSTVLKIVTFYFDCKHIKVVYYFYYIGVL